MSDQLSTQHSALSTQPAVSGTQHSALSTEHSSARCRHLLSKGLFINALVPKGQEVTGDGYFWCGHTQTGWGPDDRICDKEPCCNPSRGCYEGA